MSWWDVSSADEAMQKACAAWDKATATQLDFNRLLQGLPYKPEWKILEVGCGPGRLLKPLRQHFSIVDGIDYSPSMIQYAKEYLVEETNGETVVNDGNTIPFPDNSYDFVFAFTVFQHIRSVQVVTKYLNEMYRVLKPGGWMRFQIHDTSEPNFGRWEEDLSSPWGNAYTPDELYLMMQIAWFHTILVEPEKPWLWVTGVKL